MTLLLDPETFEELLDADERGQPGVIFVGSASCPSCEPMRRLYPRLSRWVQGYDFYDLNVDNFAETIWDGRLIAAFRDLELQYIPSQILLPTVGSPQIVQTNHPKVFLEKLSTLY